MPQAFLDVTDVAGIEIYRLHIWAGIKYRHACLTLDATCAVATLQMKSIGRTAEINEIRMVFSV